MCESKCGSLPLERDSNSTYKSFVAALCNWLSLAKRERVVAQSASHAICKFILQRARWIRWGALVCEAAVRRGKKTCVNFLSTCSLYQRDSIFLCISAFIPFHALLHFSLPTHNPSRFISRLVQQRHSTRHHVVVFCTCAFNSRLLAPFYTEERQLTTFIRKNIFFASCQLDVQKRKWQIWNNVIDWNKWHNRVGHMWMS